MPEMLNAIKTAKITAQAFLNIFINFLLSSFFHDGVKTS